MSSIPSVSALVFSVLYWTFRNLLVGFMGMATVMTRRRGAGFKFQVGLKPLEFRSNELYTLLHTVLKE
jgi:hypothetical protein